MLLPQSGTFTFSAGVATGGGFDCVFHDEVAVTGSITVTKICGAGAPVAATDRFQVLVNGTASGTPLACTGTTGATVPAPLNPPVMVTEGASGTTTLASYAPGYSL